MENKIKVVELFAGVGGFRLGLEGWNNKSASSNYKEDFESVGEMLNFYWKIITGLTKKKKNE